MASTAPTPGPGSPIRPVHRHRAAVAAQPNPPAAPSSPSPHRPGVPTPRDGVATDAAWAGGQRRFARAVTWTLPGYAVLLLVCGLAETPDPDRDFGRYAAYVASDGYRYRAIGVLAATWLGLLGIVALSALLAGTRARHMAIAGLLVGLTGAVLTLPLQGLRGLGEPLVGRAYQQGDQAGAVAVQAGLHDTTTAWLTLAGLLLGTLGWLLLGAATVRARVLNRADGYLLGLAALLLCAAGYLPVAQIAGALLFLAAALGIAFTAHRLVPPPD